MDIEQLNRFAIIVPAHNEESIIRLLIESVNALAYPKEKYELIVIADNCTDKTEQIVQSKGVRCFTRADSAKKGKPYALQWLFNQIDIDQFDAFSIIDADTIVDRQYLTEMNAKLASGAEAVQGYFGIMNPEDSWLTRLMVIPGILKFRIRYFCKDKMFMSCPLMGNGMCFSRKIIEKYGWNAFSITENWEYYIKLLLKGHLVSYAEDAVIYSHSVTALSHGETQRKRWFKGRLGVLIDYYGILLSKAIKNKDINLLDALIELAMPSYSMLFIWTFLVLVLMGFINLFGVDIYFYLKWTILLVAVQCVYFAISLIISKAPLKTWLMLIYIPVFLIWKFVVTLKGLIRFKEKTWQKTERKF